MDRAMFSKICNCKTIWLVINRTKEFKNQQILGSKPQIFSTKLLMTYIILKEWMKLRQNQMKPESACDEKTEIHSCN